jgi:hypothetical protein
MGTPTRYLDERQRMLRDQAHRSAFGLLKVACLILPALFLAQFLPWFRSSSIQLDVKSPRVFVAQDILVFRGNSSPMVTAYQMVTPHPVAFVFPAPLSMPATPLEIALATGVLLLSLFLFVSALPRAVLACKKHM